MTAETIGLYATAVCLLIGSGFVLVGVIGLLKFNDPMARLHARGIALQMTFAPSR